MVHISFTLLILALAFHQIIVFIFIMSVFDNSNNTSTLIYTQTFQIQKKPLGLFTTTKNIHFGDEGCLLIAPMYLKGKVHRKEKKTDKCQFCPYTYLRTDIFLFFPLYVTRCVKIVADFCRKLMIALNRKHFPSI